MEQNKSFEDAPFFQEPEESNRESTPLLNWLLRFYNTWMRKEQGQILSCDIYQQSDDVKKAANVEIEKAKFSVEKIASILYKEERGQ